MNDSNKAALGLTPMTVEINSSKYANGCHFDSADTVSIEVKWNKHLYPHLQGYCIYVWQGTPPWYVGNVLYRANLDSPYFQSMLDDDIFYQFIRLPNITNFTVTGLTPNLRYLIGVSAISNDDVYSDMYLTSVTAKIDSLTPKIVSATPVNNQINVEWLHYTGFNPSGYTLYVWSNEPSWFTGEGWYNTAEDSSLATTIFDSAAASYSVAVEYNAVLVDTIADTEHYYFGVVAYVGNAVTDIYVVHLLVGDTWKWIPRGEITQNIDWGTNVIDFETGVQQYQQKYIKPTRTFTATFSGRAKMWYEMRDFIDAHKGSLMPFYLWVNEGERNVKYVVRLADSKLNPKFQTEIVWGRTQNGLARRKHVGFEIELSFIEVKSYSPRYESDPSE